MKTRMKTRTGMLSDTNTRAMTALSFGVTNAAERNANRWHRPVRSRLMALPPLFEGMATFRSCLGICDISAIGRSRAFGHPHTACRMVRLAEAGGPEHARGRRHAR